MGPSSIIPDSFASVGTWKKINEWPRNLWL